MGEEKKFKEEIARIISITARNGRLCTKKDTLKEIGVKNKFTEGGGGLKKQA